MGRDEVAYHQATVVGRGDDHAGRALAYYGSRGETPLRWAGTGAARLGLAGEVTPEAYAEAFGPGGFRLHGRRLVRAERPGFELVVAAHKSVAVLGVLGQAEGMHQVLDVETNATMAWLDDWFRARGGRRGRVQQRCATAGLTYAVTRHATSRAGDPGPHDHVLVANVVEMLDQRGGHKALDSAALRDTVEAATMVGRLHSAWRARQLGFAIETDDGPSGHLRHWRITAVPEPVCGLFSKRRDEIDAYLDELGHSGYRAGNVAARATRDVKRHTGVDELLPRWHAELEAAGWPVERLVAGLSTNRTLPESLTAADRATIAERVTAIDGPLLRNRKVFTRTTLTAELAPLLYGHDPAQLDVLLDEVLDGRQVVPLLHVGGAREQCYTTAAVLEHQLTIAHVADRLADLPGPAVAAAAVEAAIAAKEAAVGRPLTSGQRQAVEAICSGGHGFCVIVGVAGSGKTTALDAATTALDHAGVRVLGTSTSGQAARNLGAEAGIDTSTFASLLWRLEHGTEHLDPRTVVIVDEAGMANDADLARLALAANHAGASLVLVGDPRQLDPVGPGGALCELVERHPELVITLDTNVRQHDLMERRALAELRAGDPTRAIDFYVLNDRIHTTPTRPGTLAAMVDQWATDVAAGHDTLMLAWRRADVDALNRLARHHARRTGHLDGPDVVIDGRPLAAGDRLVATAPNKPARLVTSQHLTIIAVTPGQITATTGDGRAVVLSGEAIDRRHFDHGYALTVHRAQGATCDRAHVLTTGGGRELAYVALSRARDVTVIHTVADSLHQAFEDLRADWGSGRRQRWISDTPATPGREPTLAPTGAERVRRQLGAGLATPARQSPSVPGARALLLRRQGDLEDLRTGTGRWADTSEGEIARTLVKARLELEQARRRLRSPELRRRDRRRAAADVAECEARHEAAEHRWQITGAPTAETLEQAVADAAADLARSERDEVRQRLADLGIEPRGRVAGLDGVRPPGVEPSGIELDW